MPRALVVGAGDLGLRVVRLLLTDNWDVDLVRRRDVDVPLRVRRHVADITDTSAVAALDFGEPAPFAAVVVCVTAGRSDEAAYRAVYVDGTARVLDALAVRHGVPERAVFVSSTAVYAQRDGEDVDETASTEPQRFNGRATLDAEAVVAARVPGAVAARLGGIYGPGRTRLLERVRRGEEAVGPGRADPYTNRIHVDDAARGIVFLAAHPSPPAVVNVVDEEPVRRSEVVRWLAAELGVSVPEARPADVADGAGRDDDKRVVNARLRSLGFTLHYPNFRDGYGPLLADRP